MDRAKKEPQNHRQVSCLETAQPSGPHSFGRKRRYLVFILKLLRGAELQQTHVAQPLEVLHHRKNVTPGKQRGGAGSSHRTLSCGQRVCVWAEGVTRSWLPLLLRGTWRTGLGILPLNHTQPGQWSTEPTTGLGFGSISSKREKPPQYLQSSSAAFTCKRTLKFNNKIDQPTPHLPLCFIHKAHRAAELTRTSCLRDLAGRTLSSSW